MKAPDTISRLPPPSASMQFDTLLKQGVAACQQLAGDVWTDFNEHDPGVTILEQLCFAITELGFRANYPIAELVAPSIAAARATEAPVAPASAPSGGGANAAAPSARGLLHTTAALAGNFPAAVAPEPTQCARHTLFTGDRILSCSPLVIDDYRKLLYDQVRNLKNVWLQKVDAANHPYGARGMLRVLIETFGEELGESESAAHAELTGLLQHVSALMHANRNLGEDLAEITVLEPCDFTVDATVVLEDNTDPVDVLAKILFGIQFDLVPFPKVSPIAPRMQQGTQPDQLYIGPLLKMGLIDDGGLSAKCDSVSTDSLYQIMLGVPGVKAVRDLQINGGDGPLTIASNAVPRLKPSIFSRSEQQNFTIALERNGANVPFDSDMVRHRIARLFAKLKKQEVFSQEQVESAAYVKLPVADCPDVRNYYSVQHHFPATYGIGRFGRIVNATDKDNGVAMRRRVAQTRQLQAYLLFFEQVLANGAAQLADAWQLFDLEQDLDRSYFYQPVVSLTDYGTEPPDMLDVLAGPPPTAAKEQVRHVVYVNATDRHAEILLRSREFDSLEQAEATRLRILAAAMQEDHYRVLSLPSGEFGLILNDRHHGQGLAFASVRFDSEHAARKEIARIAAFLRDVSRDRQELARRIAVEAKGIYGIKLIDDSGDAILAVEHLTLHMQKWSAAALLKYGDDVENYRIRQLKSGDFMLVLHAGQDQSIAHGVQRFSSRENALTGRQAAAALVRRLLSEPSRQTTQLSYLPPSTRGAEGNANKLAYHSQQLDALVRKFDDFLERRNRFLNHLLARFGERFDDDALQRFDPAPTVDRQAFLRDLVKWKITFLQQCVHFGADRNLGVDVSKMRAGATSQRSVLEQRLACLLGLPAAGESVAPGFEYGDGASVAHVLNARQFAFTSDRPDLAQALLRYGVRRENYTIKEKKDAVHVTFAWPNDPKGAHEVYRAENRSQAEAAIDALVNALIAYPQDRARLYAGEELYLQEHILLLPQIRSSTPTAADLKHVASRIDWEGLQWKLEIDAPERGELFRLALDSTRHRIVLIDGKYHQLELVDDNGRVVARNMRGHLTHRRAQEARREFLVHLRKTAQPVMEENVAPAAAPTSPDDFYSYRLSVMLPDWPIRMQNLEFRKFVQRTVDENCPAHLSAQCYWLTLAQMTEFKRLRDEWAPLRSTYTIALATRKPSDKIPEVDQLNEAAAALEGFLRARIAGAAPVEAKSEAL